MQFPQTDCKFMEAKKLCISAYHSYTSHTVVSIVGIDLMFPERLLAQPTVECIVTLMIMPVIFGYTFFA